MRTKKLRFSKTKWRFHWHLYVVLCLTAFFIRKGYCISTLDLDKDHQLIKHTDHVYKDCDAFPEHRDLDMYHLNFTLYFMYLSLLNRFISIIKVSVSIGYAWLVRFFYKMKKSWMFTLWTETCIAPGFN